MWSSLVFWLGGVFCVLVGGCVLCFGWGLCFVGELCFCVLVGGCVLCLGLGLWVDQWLCLGLGVVFGLGVRGFFFGLQQLKHKVYHSLLSAVQDAKVRKSSRFNISS